MIFKNKKAELVKEKALVEIEDFSQRMLEKMKFSFDVMQERDNYKGLYEIEKNKNKELEKNLREKKDVITSQNLDIIRLTKNADKLFECLWKLAVIVKDHDKKLYDEIQDLKSERYLRVPEKPMKETKQRMGMKSGTKTSKIIKAVKEG